MFDVEYWCLVHCLASSWDRLGDGKAHYDDKALLHRLPSRSCREIHKCFSIFRDLMAYQVITFILWV
jgi:hypothetical protein